MTRGGLSQLSNAMLFSYLAGLMFVFLVMFKSLILVIRGVPEETLNARSLLYLAQLFDALEAGLSKAEAEKIE